MHELDAGVIATAARITGELRDQLQALAATVGNLQTRIEALETAARSAQERENAAAYWEDEQESRRIAAAKETSRAIHELEQRGRQLENDLWAEQQKRAAALRRAQWGG